MSIDKYQKLRGVRAGVIASAVLLASAGCGEDDGGVRVDAAADGAVGGAGGGSGADGGTPGRGGFDGGLTAGLVGGSDGGRQPVGASGFLIAADLKAEKIFAYSLPDLALTGQIDGVLLGNHVGALALADGRVITTDDKAGEVIAIKVDAAGKPAIVNRVAAALGTGAVWGCADAALGHVAIASGREGNMQTTNIVKLDDFSLTRFESTMKVEEELHSFLAGDPGHLFVGLGGEIQAFSLAAVRGMTAPMAAAVFPVGLGSHGPLVTHTHKRVYVSTKAGLDGVDYGATPFARATLIPWDVDGRTTGQNFRPRLSWDGRYAYGAVAVTTPEGAEKWAEREVDFHAADLSTQTAKRLPLTKGNVARFQLSKKHAFFANIAADGDFGILVGVDPAAPAEFHKVVARVPLPKLANGPVAGQSAAGKETRGSAITPDGRWAFVTQGGEGKISVIDTDSRAVTGTIATPTPLAGGGYLIAVQPGTTPTDTCTR